MPGPQPRPIIDRLSERTAVVDLDHETPCWVVDLRPTPQNYQRVRTGGREVYVHRWVYEHFVGPIPDDHEVDHLCHAVAVARGLCEGGPTCRHRACWRPRHLKAVTHRCNYESSVFGQGVRRRGTDGRFVTQGGGRYVITAVAP